MRAVEPYVKEKLPQFDTMTFNDALRFFTAELDGKTGDTKIIIARWLERQIEIYGDEFELQPMEQWLSIDPIEELTEDLELAGKSPNIIEVHV